MDKYAQTQRTLNGDHMVAMLRLEVRPSADVSDEKIQVPPESSLRPRKVAASFPRGQGSDR